MLYKIVLYHIILYYFIYYILYTAAHVHIGFGKGFKYFKMDDYFLTPRLSIGMTTTVPSALGGSSPCMLVMRDPVQTRN